MIPKVPPRLGGGGYIGCAQMLRYIGKVCGNTAPHRVGANTTLHRVCANATPHRVCANTTPHRVCANAKLHRVCANTTLHRFCANWCNLREVGPQRNAFRNIRTFYFPRSHIIKFSQLGVTLRERNRKRGIHTDIFALRLTHY